MKKSEKKPKKSLNFLLGADEVGRGPLAGPVTVCVASMVKGTEKMVKKTLRAAAGKAYPIGKDSKKMTEKEREFWFEYISNLHKDGAVMFFTDSMSAKEIDKKGIAVCIKNILDGLVERACENGDRLSRFNLLCDAGLKTSIPINSQKAIVKGDEKEFIISVASVYAKVSRDRYMGKEGKKEKHKKYKFNLNKGYGTFAHRQAIKKFGLTSLHRKSFCTRIVQNQKALM